MSSAKFEILLIDDSPSDAELFATALKEAAPRVRLYWVATAQEGADYLRQLNRFSGAQPVSIVVCDLNMPGTSGFDFIMETKRDRGTSSIPLIVYSSSADPRDVDRCYEAGANSYIVKPMTFGAMVDQLKSLAHYWLEVVRLPGAPQK